MNPLSLNKNKTTAFAMPLALKGFNANQIVTDGFINAYIADIDKPEWDDYILLVFEDKREFETLQEVEYQRDDDYIYVFNIPDDLLDDYFKIIKGEYSEISEKAKQIILSFWGVEEDSTLYKVLNRVIEKKLGDRIEPKKIKELLPSFSLYEEVYGMGSGL